MSLLPTRPDAEPAEDAGPRVIGVDDDEADDVLAALSSGTARRVLAALHDDPAPPSELADRVDTSLQNVQYHLEKLEAAGAVEVVETAYSAKGREMDVYAPADRPLVVFAGDEERGETLRTALRRLLGAVGLLAVGSLFVQAIYGEGVPLGVGGDGGGVAPSGGADGAAPADAERDVTTEAAEAPVEAADTATETATGTPEATETATQTATETVGTTATPPPTTTETVEAAGRAATEGAAGLPPGLLFFAGGLFVIAAVAAVWYLGSRRR